MNGETFFYNWLANNINYLQEEVLIHGGTSSSNFPGNMDLTATTPRHTRIERVRVKFTKTIRVYVIGAGEAMISIDGKQLCKFHGSSGLVKEYNIANIQNKLQRLNLWDDVLHCIPM